MMNDLKFSEVWDKLPEAQKLINEDPAVRAFMHRIAEEPDPYKVIDEMLVYFSRVTKQQRELLERSIALTPPAPIIIQL